MMKHCDSLDMTTGAILAGLTHVLVYTCSFIGCFESIVRTDDIHVALTSNYLGNCGICISQIPFEAPAGSIALTGNEFEPCPASPISMCGMNRSDPSTYAGILQGFGNTIDCDPSALCSDNYECPEGLFVVNGG